jgi:hypothetical protein
MNKDGQSRGGRMNKDGQSRGGRMKPLPLLRGSSGQNGPATS